MTVTQSEQALEEALIEQLGTLVHVSIPYEMAFQAKTFKKGLLQQMFV